MCKSGILLCILLFVVPANAETTQWYTYEKGIAAASSMNKLIILDFYADWCAPCIEMEKNTYPDKKVVLAMKDFIAIKVDTQIRIDIEKKYNIAYYPTVVFLDPKGREISRHVGYLGPEDMIKTIQEARGKLPKEAAGFEALYLFVALLLYISPKYIPKKPTRTFC